MEFIERRITKKNIGSIQVFINMIFKDLIKIIKQCKISKDIKEREKIENQVEDLISKSILKYPEYFKLYSENNEKLNLNPTNLKTLLSELIPLNSESYPEKEFPMFKYFIYTKYKSEDDMLKRINNKGLYPLINGFLAYLPNLKKLKYLPAFNEFTNYMVNYYSFKISREEARNRQFINEEIFKENGFNIKYNNFIEAWEQVKFDSVKYKCNPEMEVKSGFRQDDKLINFLNDYMEFNNGMYIAASFQNFIEWQNEFLQQIINANINDGILHKYVDNILKKIPIHEAKPEQIIIIEEKFKKNGNKFVDFNDLIYTFSKRKIFGNDGTINYFNYNNFEYDYDKIEEELGKILLPDVCLFKGEDELNFIKYWGEGFRGKNSDIISNFFLKYPQIDLNTKEKQEIIEYISNMNKIYKSYDFKNFYGSLQKLLFYLTKQEIINENETLSNILKNCPENIKLSSDCENFFYNEGKNLTVNKLMNLFFFFEHLSFKYFTDNLSPNYKLEIPKDKTVKIMEKLLEKNNSEDKINIIDLAAATRRLISRYLSGDVSYIDISEKKDLFFELGREELWEEKIRKFGDLSKLIFEKIGEFKLVVGQAYEFYNLIGEDDKKSLNDNNQN